MNYYFLAILLSPVALLIAIETESVAMFFWSFPLFGAALALIPMILRGSLSAAGRAASRAGEARRDNFERLQRQYLDRSDFLKALHVMRKFDLLTPEQDDRIRAEGEQSVFSNLPVKEADLRAFFKNATLKDAEDRLNWFAAEDFVNQREAQEIQTAIEAKYDPRMQRIYDMLGVDD